MSDAGSPVHSETRVGATMSPAAAAPVRVSRRDRRGLRQTPEGLIFLLMTLGVGMGAVNTGNNLLYLVLGLMLSLILLSGMLSDVVLAGVRPVRRLAPACVRQRAVPGRDRAREHQALAAVVLAGGG